MPTQPRSPGARLRSALRTERPLQVVGTINAYCARLAQRAGYRAIYLSGAGVANASLGVPDLGITSLNDVCEDVRRITQATDLPLLVDADTGWGGAFMIGRTVRELARAGAAGCHIEDQVQAKRCGHRPGKQLVSVDEMCDRIRSAVDARSDPQFVVMARTDSHAVEGIGTAIKRARAYAAAGADMIFAELRSAGVAIALYPLGAFRAMSRAAEGVYAAIRREGTQKSAVGAMQTRAELYEVLGYEEYERRLDRLSGARGGKDAG